MKRRDDFLDGHKSRARGVWLTDGLTILCLTCAASIFARSAAESLTTQISIPLFFSVSARQPETEEAATSSTNARIRRASGLAVRIASSFSASVEILWRWPLFSLPRCAKTSAKTDSSALTRQAARLPSRLEFPGPAEATPRVTH